MSDAKRFEPSRLYDDGMRGDPDGRYVLYADIAADLEAAELWRMVETLFAANGKVSVEDVGIAETVEVDFWTITEPVMGVGLADAVRAAYARMEREITAGGQR